MSEEESNPHSLSRDAFLVMIPAFTFLLGMAAIATDIDEDLDTKVEAGSMWGVINLGAQHSQ